MTKFSHRITKLRFHTLKLRYCITKLSYCITKVRYCKMPYMNGMEKYDKAVLAFHRQDICLLFISRVSPILTKVYGRNMRKSLFSILFEHVSMLVDSFNSLSHIHKNKIIKDTLKAYFGKVLHYPRLQLFGYFTYLKFTPAFFYCTF